MPALDTNVLVRWLVQDDASQGRAAARLIRKAVADGQLLFVPVTVALELEWVLRSAYGFARAEVISTFSRLLSADGLVFESDAAVELALAHFQSGRADFADCLHAALATQAAQAPLWTFDRAAARVAGARHVSAG